MSLKGLSGKVAVVTGAGRGIGRAVVERLCDEGVQIVACDINSEALTDLRGGPGIVCVTGDIATEDGADRCAIEAIKTYGRLDFLAHSAGILSAVAPIVEMKPAEFDRVMAVNVRGTMLAMRSCLRKMIERGEGGAIVCITSRAAFRPSATRAAYNASKAGVISLMETAALENGKHNIRVNAVSPGVVDTPILGAAGSGLDALKASLANWPVPRMAKAEEIANVITWLLSDEAAFVTGSVYKVDGGSTI